MPVSYNDYIKSPGIQIEYTKEMIQELINKNEVRFRSSSSKSKLGGSSSSVPLIIYMILGGSR